MATMYLTVRDVGERLNVSRDTARRLMLQMHHTEIGNERKRYWVTEAELDRFMASKQPTQSKRKPLSKMTIPRRKE